MKINIGRRKNESKQKGIQVETEWDFVLLCSQVLEEYTTNRRNILVRQFIDALTSGGRPIELRATEPKRYVGDMLAWLHQAVPAERDNLNFLLRNCDVIGLLILFSHWLVI